MRADKVNDTIWETEYDEWLVIVEDGNGFAAVQSDTGEAGELNIELGEIYQKPDGSTFGVNTTEEFVVKNGEWVENS